MNNISIKASKKISVSIGKTNSTKVQVNSTIVKREEEREKYEGSYIVESDVKDQMLETKDKVMTDDVTILKIPVWEVSNESDGTTFYIGRND